ncbi:MAG: restriction endonuclease subunit S, partial [Actinobacteria bacterium]|nr:restriction endonuclease subunit S [Actinomycetota bacterium]
HSVAKVPAPGVVTGRYGTLGNVFFIEEPFWPLNTALYVRDFKGNEPRFVAALLEVLQLAKSEGASAVPGVNRNHLHRLPVLCPDTRTQQHVATILGALDDLIENNRWRIELLEQMAQAIYREWFVHFHYPGHDAARFVDSTVRSRPPNWDLTPLKSCATALVDGDWIETKNQAGTDFRLVQVSNVGVGRFRETGKYRYVTAETLKRLRCTEINVGDLLISRLPEPVGRAWLVDHLDERAITAVDVAILTPVSPAMGSYLNQVLNSEEHLAFTDAVSTGTTRKRVTRSVLSQSQVLRPPPVLLERFHETAAPLAQLGSRLRRTNAALSELRDLLLPKLVTGEIDVSHLDLDAVGESVA